MGGGSAEEEGKKGGKRKKKGGSGKNCHVGFPPRKRSRTTKEYARLIKM
jgi:hypothetical protein